MLSSSVAPQLPEHGRDPVASAIHTALTVAIAIFVMAVIGVLTRPVGFLAPLWPANAVLAAVLLQVPSAQRLPALAGAFLGYQAGGFAAGDLPWHALQLTASNMVSAVTFAFVFHALVRGDVGLAHVRAVTALAAATIVASSVAGVIGGPVSAATSDLSYFDAWRTWFASEFMNYLVLMPGLVAINWPLRWPGRSRWNELLSGPALIPILTVAITLLVSIVIHPFALVFSVPALIWAALSIPLAATCVLIVAFTTIVMLALSRGLYNFGPAGLNDPLLAAVHLGVAMIALAPVLVAAATSERRRQFAELEQAARLDTLTEALNRGAFMQQASAMIEQQTKRVAPLAVVLLDVDHFKRINDHHGHAAGDQALVTLAAVIRRSIRGGDLFGRLGGEEFGLLLPDAELAHARLIAERIREQVERLEIRLDEGKLVNMTISVGVAAAAMAAADLPEMLSLADKAMYEAKRVGRNRVVVRDLGAGNQDEDGKDGGNGSVTGTQLQAGPGDHPV